MAPGGLDAAFGYGVLFATGLTVGLAGLALYERWMAVKVSGTAARFGPRRDGDRRGSGTSMGCLMERPDV